MDNHKTFTRQQFLAKLAPIKSPAVSSENAASERLQENFTSLFDGQTLQGWHTNLGEIGHGTGGRWAVEKGVLTGQQDPPGSGNGGILMTDQMYGDFELLVDLAPDWDIDSGVFLRTNNKGEGYQVYVDYRDNGNIGHISTENADGNRMFIRPYTIFAEKDSMGNITGFVTKPDEREVAWDPEYLEYTATPEEFLAAWKIGQWNTLRIRCVGKYPRITTWINYTKIAEFDGATTPHPNYDREKMYQAVGREGAIALQVHNGASLWRKGAKCRWKNIRVRPL